MDEALKFIEEQRAAGLEDDQIRQALLRSGWDIARIEQAFTQATHSQPQDQTATTPPTATTSQPQTGFQQQQPPLQPQQSQQPLQTPSQVQPQPQPQNQPQPQYQQPQSVFGGLLKPGFLNIKNLFMIVGIIVALFIGIMLFQLTGGANTGTALLNNPPQGYSIKSGDDYDILIPDSWITDSNSSSSFADIYFSEELNLENFGEVTVLGITTIQSDKPPADFVQEEIDNSASGNETELISSEPREVEDYVAQRFEFLIKGERPDGSDSRVLVMAVKVGEKIHMASCKVPANQWDEFEEQVNTIINSFVPRVEQIEKEPKEESTGSDNGLTQSRIITQRKSDTGRLLAWAEGFAANNNGVYPVSAGAIPSAFSEYIGSNADFKDPVTDQPYSFTSQEPTLGSFQYLTGYECTGREVSAASSTRSILFRTLLDDDTYYCQDNN